MEVITDNAVQETNEVLKRFGVTPKNDASHGPPSNPPINPSGFGNQSGSGSSGSSGSSGGSGNSSSGGNLPPGNPPPSGGASNNGGNHMNVKTKLLLFALMAVVFTSLTGAMTVIFLGVKSTTPEGIARANRLAELENEKDARRHAEVMEKLAQKRGQQGYSKTSTSGSQLATSSNSTPVPSNCKLVGSNEGTTRLTSIQPSFGQCVTLTGTEGKQIFFLILDGPPKEILGRASFVHMREEMESDKVERRARCMEKNGDTAFCEAEMQKPAGVRVGEPCLTKDSPDKCVTYLKGKIHVPIVVHSDTSVSIIMN